MRSKIGRGVSLQAPHRTHLARRLARDAGGGGGGDELLHLQPLLEVVLSFAHGFCVCLLLASWLPLLWAGCAFGSQSDGLSPKPNNKENLGSRFEWAGAVPAPLSVSPQNLALPKAFTGGMYTEGKPSSVKNLTTSRKPVLRFGSIAWIRRPLPESGHGQMRGCVLQAMSLVVVLVCPRARHTR